MNKHSAISDLYIVMYEIVKEHWKENLEEEFEKIKQEAQLWLAEDEREEKESEDYMIT